MSFNGSIQPLKPIEFKLRLRGILAPHNTRAQDAWFYTSTKDLHGYRLIPTVIENGNVLHGQFTHLSLKFLEYLNPANLLGLMGILPGVAQPRPVSDCAQSVNLPTIGKIQLAKSQAWSTDQTSPVHPCLKTNGDNGQLRVVNNSHFVWPIAATAGVKITSKSDSPDDEAVKSVAKLLFGDANGKIKGYLSRGSEAIAALPESSLPATVQLQASPNAFLAESVWISLKFAVGLFAGENPPEIVKLTQKVLDALDVEKCLQSAIKISGGNPTPENVFSFIMSNCTTEIAHQIGDVATNGIFWKNFLGRFITIVNGILDATGNALAALTGIVSEWKELVKEPLLIAVASTSNPFAPFVDKWRHQTSTLTILKNYTGTLSWPSSTCASSTSLNCQGEGTLRFTFSTGVLTGRFSKTIYIDPNGNSFTPQVGEYEAGDTLRLAQLDPPVTGVIRTPHGAADGSDFYYCTTAAPDNWKQKCNF